MKRIIIFLLCALALNLVGIAGVIDGSKEPDRIPDQVAFRLYYGDNPSRRHLRHLKLDRSSFSLPTSRIKHHRLPR